MDNTTAVEVLTKHGSISSPRCTVDVFDDGILTMTSTDDGYVIREIPAGGWLSATVWHRGYPAYTLTPTNPRKES